VQTVYVVGREDKVEVRTVTAGDRVGSSWIIEQGLQPGDRVVVEGQQKVRPGSKVQTQPYRTSDSPAAGN